MSQTAVAKQLTLQDLDEPGKFVVRRSVPVFCEHKDPETGEEWTRAKLEHLARVNNRRMQEEDTPGTVVLGHTPGRKEEDIQTVGYKKNYHVRRFGKKNKLGLMVDLYFKPDCYEKSKEYPHRSIELWTDDMIIEPLSLLARRPELDLGLLIPEDGPTQKKQLVNDGCELMVYSRGGKRRIYQMGGEVEQPPANDCSGLLNELCDGLEALIAKVREKAGEATGGGAPEEQKPVIYEASPSGTNTAMPELLTYSKEQYDAMVAERDAAKAERDQFKTKLEATQIERDEFKRLYHRQGRLQVFEKLKDEGVQLDAEAELADTESLDEAAFEKHVAKVKRCYARSGRSTSGMIPTDDTPQVTGGDDATEYERFRPRVLAYANKHKCDTKFAFEMVKAGKD